MSKEKKGFANFEESENLELKRTVTDGIKKEVIAFANCDGGEIFIGVDDNGKVCGVKNPDEIILQASNMVRDSIKPDVTMFVRYDVLKEKGESIVKISVQQGTSKPYYLATKGLRSEGVFVRQGTSSVPATDAAIRLMIKETDGETFEEIRSLEQSLSFDFAKKEFKTRDISFGEKQMQTLKILNSNKIFTNLGLFLSDQCLHTVKVAVFEGDNQTIFKDRREFGGSLLRQLKDIFSFIDIYNKTHGTYQGLLRNDTRDYPEIAIREALLNMLVHRDYSFSASSLVNIYDDRIEFISVGGLVNGILLDDIMMGLSICRNKNLADVFYRLQLIEAYGTGIKKIMEVYSDYSKKPVIEVSPNAFKIILPNINFIPSNKKPKFSDEETKVINLAKQKGSIARSDVEILLGVSMSTAARILKSMVEKNILIKQGNGPKSKYISA